MPGPSEFGPFMRGKVLGPSTSVQPGESALSESAAVPDHVWLPRFACPECRTPVEDDCADGHACPGCGCRFAHCGGIFRFLARSRAEAASPFLQQYRLERERGGYRTASAEACRMLPSVVRDDPHAAEWRLRRESYRHLEQHALPAVWGGPVRVLDLGAGNGWVAHRLASFGHRVVAVDLIDDEVDGLGACRHYPVAFPAVQADFVALPFEPSQFDLAIFGASLHYAPRPERALAEARRMLAEGGAIVIMDSPVAGVPQMTAGLGLGCRFVESRGSFGSRLRRLFSRFQDAPPAGYGVWVIQ
jgi:SAM-dependent methyltransferase